MPENLIPTTERKTLRYDFSAVEIHDLSLQLASKTKELNSIEEEKKSVTSQYAAKVNETKATCNKLSNQVSDGWEFREIECSVAFHKPIQGFKTLTRKDNDKVIEEKMSDYEWNLFNQPEDEETTELLDKERDKLKGGKKRGR